jgi:hypothetical protein
VNNRKQSRKQLSLPVGQFWQRGLSLLAVVILLLGVLSVTFGGHAKAAQITERSLTLSSGIVSASSTSYTFGFKLGTTGQVQGLKFQACTTALGTCTAPTGLTFASTTFTSQTGWTGGTNFAVDLTGANDCVASASILCAKRTDTTSENTTGAKTVKFGTITNPSGASCSGSNPNCTFFVRMTTYTTNTWTAVSIVDTGTVASSTAATLTISAQVAEVLNFCVGTTTINNDSSTTGADCSAISGTSVNLGTLDSGNVTITPVSSNGGNNVNGVAMVRTNAYYGTTIQYRAIQQSGTNHQGALRVPSATCAAGSSNTDQCFTSAGTTQTTFTAGTEKYGMTIAGVNCGSTTSYSCSYTTSGNNHLLPNAQYDGSGFTAGSSNTFGTGQGFAWDESGSFSTIASTSVGDSSSAVDDEALILKFAATPDQITPTGSYQAQTDFIVVSTY